MIQLETQAKTDKQRYRAGQDIICQVILENKGSKTADLVFNSTQRYDFIVTRGGNAVWYWSNDKMFGMITEEVHLKQGESIVYSEKWGQKEALSGAYELKGIITSNPPQVSSCRFILSK